MKIDRNNFLIAAAMLGLGSVAVPACGGSSADSERETEVATNIETEGGELEREVETEVDVETDDDGDERTVTTTREVECEAEGDMVGRCREQRSARRLTEPRQAQPGSTAARPVAAGPKPEIVYEGRTAPPAANPPQADTTPGPTQE